MCQIENEGMPVLLKSDNRFIYCCYGIKLMKLSVP